MIEKVILVAAWITTILVLIRFVPKNKIREAHVIFLFKQLMTWLFGLMVANYGLIEYPFRLFPYATKGDFTFEFLIYPAICVIFVLYYPLKKSMLRQLVHYISYTTAITLFEVIIERYTKIIIYVHWTWYLTWITIFITFYFSRIYYLWFFKRTNEKNQR